MSLDRWLGVAGVLLSLPGFLVLFLSSQHTVAALVLLLGVTVLLSAALVYHYTNLPEYSLKSVDVLLELRDDAGKRAVLSKTYEIVPNYAHLDSMAHRNIAADGSIENICWNGAPVPRSCIRQVLGQCEVTVSFGAPLPRWKEFSGCLSYEVVDSFPAATEALHYVVDFPVKRLRIRIQMPPGRPASNPRATRKAGLRRALRNPKLINQGRTVELTVTRPMRGAEYSVFWDW